jgi:hypothetical protein
MDVSSILLYGAIQLGLDLVLFLVLRAERPPKEVAHMPVN